MEVGRINLSDVLDGVVSSNVSVIAANQAIADANDAVTAANDAVTSAASSATEAEGYKDAAQQAVTDVTNAGQAQVALATAQANKAEGLRNKAEGFEEAAEGYKDEALVARNDAIVAKDLAEYYRDEAEAAEQTASNYRDLAQIDMVRTQQIYDHFDDRYLGSKTENPSYDNDGGTLQEGALYWNSAVNSLRLWDGTEWVNPTVSQELLNTILALEDIEAEMVTLSGLTTEITTVAGDTAAINEIYDNRVEIYAADDNAAIATAKAGEALASANAAAISEGNASTSETNALASENKAEQWATEAEDTEVEPGRYSAYHYAQKADDSAIAAAASEATLATKLADIDTNTAARHTHSNKAILDSTTASYTTAEKASVDIATVLDTTAQTLPTAVNELKSRADSADSAIASNDADIAGLVQSILNISKSTAKGQFGDDGSMRVELNSAYQVLPAVVKVQSTDTDKFEINPDGSITVKEPGEYSFISTVTFEDMGADGDIGNVTFQIMDTADDTVYYTESTSIEIGGYDREIIPFNSLVIAPDTLTYPVTANIRARVTGVGAGDYDIIGLSSVISATNNNGTITQEHDELVGRDTADSHPASAISVTPNGNLSSNTVQLALEELQNDVDTIDNIGTWS